MDDSWPNADDRFQLLFGSSRQEVEDSGVDVDTYVAMHLHDSDEHLYRQFADRLAKGRGVLPYWTIGSWISHGRTKFSQSWMGSVTVRKQEIRLSDVDVLAACHPHDIDARAARGWFGMGLRLSMGAAGVWYVQPRYSPTSIRKARAANRVFVAALREAGVRFESDDHRGPVNP